MLVMERKAVVKIQSKAWRCHGVLVEQRLSGTYSFEVFFPSSHSKASLEFRKPFGDIAEG